MLARLEIYLYFDIPKQMFKFINSEMIPPKDASEAIF